MLARTSDDEAPAAWGVRDRSARLHRAPRLGAGGPAVVRQLRRPLRPAARPGHGPRAHRDLVDCRDHIRLPRDRHPRGGVHPLHGRRRDVGAPASAACRRGGSRRARWSAKAHRRQQGAAKRGHGPGRARARPGHIHRRPRASDAGGRLSGRGDPDDLVPARLPGRNAHPPRPRPPHRRDGGLGGGRGGGLRSDRRGRTGARWHLSGELPALRTDGEPHLGWSHPAAECFGGARGDGRPAGHPRRAARPAPLDRPAPVMGFLPYAVAAWLFVVGLYGIVTSRNLIHLVVCLAVVQASTYVLLLAVGYRSGGAAPIFADIPTSRKVVDPIVATLTLTDVVVEATVAALLLSLAVQAHRRFGTLDPDELGAMRG